jgi:DNA-binding transcriptional MerR regulator
VDDAEDVASDRSYDGGVRYRIEELAARCDVTVDTVRFYQARGLLPRPERDGRVAWYDDGHVERLERVRDLKARGFPLAIIARLLAGELDPQEEALAVALTGPLPGEAATGEERLSLAELSERTGVSPTLLEALEREGLLVGRVDGERPYTDADVRTVRSGLALLEAGVPLSELLALAREHDDAMRAVADRAVDLFVRFVRDPLRAAVGSELDASQRAVDLLQVMLPAVDEVVGHHFRRRLLSAARDRIARPDPALDPATEAAG